MKTIKLFVLLFFPLPVLAQYSFQRFNTNSDYFWLLIIVLAIALFILAREISTWYWKIDRRIELLEEQNNILKKIFKQLGGTEEEVEKKEKKEVRVNFPW